jgi:hypothetical protein
MQKSNVKGIIVCESKHCETWKIIAECPILVSSHPHPFYFPSQTMIPFTLWRKIKGVRVGRDKYWALCNNFPCLAVLGRIRSLRSHRRNRHGFSVILSFQALRDMENYCRVPNTCLFPPSANSSHSPDKDLFQNRTAPSSPEEINESPNSGLANLQP